uniref:Uncharacterized protein n=1 Tax=Lactuca sativa TaxID=4236 RepID=A0A9R1US94_LACSA|nr:hypothetical protein LSAT_V11C800435620 [Lactuca sativa]
MIIVWSTEEEILLARSWIDVAEDPHHSDYPSTIFWSRVAEIYNRQALQPQRKYILYAKWRNAHTLATRFTIVFRRVMHDAENGENENILLQNALEAYHVETCKDFKLVEFWQINKVNVHRVFALREAFMLFDFEDESIYDLKLMLIRCLISPLYLKMGQEIGFLTFLFRLSRQLVKESPAMIRSQIPLWRKSMLEAYVDIVFRAWKATNGETREEISWRHMQALVDSSTHEQGLKKEKKKGARRRGVEQRSKGKSEFFESGLSESESRLSNGGNRRVGHTTRRVQGNLLKLKNNSSSCSYDSATGEIPEQQQLASRAIHTAASSRGEFPSSSNGSKATMSARLASSQLRTPI